MQVTLTFKVLDGDSGEAETLAVSKSVSSNGTALRMQSPGSDAMRRITQVLSPSQLRWKIVWHHLSKDCPYAPVGYFARITSEAATMRFLATAASSIHGA